MLKVQNISIKYPGESFGAVNEVSFDLNSGEILSIVGKSGSGKTSLLRMIAGLMKPDSGEISFEGKLLENPEEQLIAGHEEIKLVFQDYRLRKNMTVYENVKYQLLHFDKDYQHERTLELLSLCKIAELKDKLTDELSGGQQQRLALANALSDDPKLLLMDEPFSSLDPMTKRQLIFDLVDIIRSEQISLVLVTHDSQDALQLSDRVGFMSEGELVQLETPVDIYNKPLNLDVAQFFGLVNEIELGEMTYNIRAEDLHLYNDSFELSFELRVNSSRLSGAYFLNHATYQQKDIWFFSDTYLAGETGYKVSFEPEKQLFL